MSSQNLLNFWLEQLSVCDLEPHRHQVPQWYSSGNKIIVPVVNDSVDILELVQWNAVGFKNFIDNFSPEMTYRSNSENVRWGFFLNHCIPKNWQQHLPYVNKVKLYYKLRCRNLTAIMGNCVTSGTPSTRS